MRRIKKSKTFISLFLTLLVMVAITSNITPSIQTSAESVLQTKAIIPPLREPDYVKPDTLYAYGGGESGSNDAWLNWILEENVHYFFLPPSVDTNVYLWSSFSDAVTVTNIDDPTDSFILESGMNGPISISTTKTYRVANETEIIIPTLMIMHSQAEGSMFITTTDEFDEYQDNMDFILEDKSNETRARYVATDDTGKSSEGIIRRFRGRGNTTWEQTKRPFNINLDVREGLYGMDSSRRWALLANYQEGSLMRNRLLYDLSHEVGLQFAPNSRFIEVYINGSYMGSYQISERVSLGNNDLVKIRNLENATETKAQQVTGNSNFDVYDVYGTEEYQRRAEYNGGIIQYYDIPDEFNPDDITGGYLLELNSEANAEGDWSRFITPRGQLVVVDSPEFVTEAQVQYIYDYYVAVEDSIYGKTDAYEDLIDVDSFAKIYLIQELAKNIDGGTKSTFFYKDSNAKLFAGPAWDYDVALGNLYGLTDGVDEKVTYNTDNPIGWFTRYIHMLEDPRERNLLGAITEIDSIWTRINQIWDESFIPAMDVINGEAPARGSRLKSIHEYERLLTDSAQMNFTIHPIPFNGNTENPYDFTWIPAVANTFSGQVDYLHEWINIRANWLTTFLPGNRLVWNGYDNGITQWDQVYGYAWNDDGDFNAQWPGVPLSNSENNIFGLLHTFDNVIFNDGTGNQTIPLIPPGGATSLNPVRPFAFRGMNPQPEDGLWVGTWAINAQQWTETHSIDFINAENWHLPRVSVWNNFLGTVPTPEMEMRYLSDNTFTIEIPTVYNRIIFSSSDGTSQTRHLAIPSNGGTYDLSTDTWIEVPR